LTGKESATSSFMRWVTLGIFVQLRQLDLSDWWRSRDFLLWILQFRILSQLLQDAYDRSQVTATIISSIFELSLFLSLLGFLKKLDYLEKVEIVEYHSYIPWPVEEQRIEILGV